MGQLPYAAQDEPSHEIRNQDISDIYVPTAENRPRSHHRNQLCIGVLLADLVLRRLREQFGTL